jgi:ADP-ribosylglycohydrolase
MALVDHIWGTYVGCALGDAMGMPTECWSQDKIVQHYPQGIHQLLPSDVDDTFGRTLQAGEVTDDTINTLMIHDMIVKNQGQINTQAYIDHLTAWSNNSAVAAYVSGPSTVKALKALAAGEPVHRTGITGTTNGASMKISPIGILADYRNPDKLIKDVYTVCEPTHNTRVALQGASAVAAAVSYGVRGGTEIDRVWEIAQDFIDRSATTGFDFPSASLSYRLQWARKIVTDESNIVTALSRLYQEVGTGMETLQSIPAAFAVVQLADGDPVRAAELSAVIGWDTDTIGAISAAICGALHPTVPPHFIDTLQTVNHLDFKKLAAEILPFVQVVE